MSAPLTPKELREFQARNELEAFYLLSVEEAVKVLASLLREPPKKSQEEGF